MSGVGLIVLAAGGSRRLGQPKQLLSYQGKSLIRHTVDCAIASVCDPIVVVVGAYADKVRSEVGDLAVSVVENPNWSMGLSTSIRLGVQFLQQYKLPLDAAILTLCDQPFLTSQLINQLVNTHQTTQQAIVATHYADTLGVPALFTAPVWNKLHELEGDRGAKALIQQCPKEAIASIPFVQGDVDIDTWEDWRSWCSSASNLS
jgi:molybdenum cofactor cytidylyltransferase